MKSTLIRRSVPGRIAAGVLIAVVCTAACAAQTEVTGRVVDADGRPVSDYQVSSFWNWQAGAPKALSEFTVDESGTFSGSVNFYGRKSAVLVYADGGSRSGLAIVAEDEAQDLVITI